MLVVNESQSAAASRGRRQGTMKGLVRVGGLLQQIIQLRYLEYCLFLPLGYPLVKNSGSVSKTKRAARMSRLDWTRLLKNAASPGSSGRCSRELK